MTYEEAIEEIENIENLCKQLCNSCTSNDWYCPDECKIIERAKQIPFEKIVKSYARNEGQLWKVARFIRRCNL